tara:strand:- start:177 stop:506 length:330 start_codon:yes stop_codon:yes gene_type:complete
MDFKKTLLIFFLFVGINTVAQNRLEFNQVINISSNITNYAIDTVPQNKVWKIAGLATTNNVNYSRPIINGATIESLSLPYWLGEGESIGVWVGTSSSIEFSIIEFNIVQ